MPPGNHPVAILAPALLRTDPAALQATADGLARDVFRTTLDQPGYGAIELGAGLDPLEFRSMLIGLAAGLDQAYRAAFGRRLVLRSVGRFDQHVSTEAHLDGAPDESILLLGYEPTTVDSRLFLIDYTRLASSLGLSPRAYLDVHNPTFGAGRERIADEAREVVPFDRRTYRIVAINNSACPPADARTTGMMGVLHKSTVVSTGVAAPRYVNTLLLAPAPRDEPDALSVNVVRAYVETGAYASA